MTASAARLAPGGEMEGVARRQPPPQRPGRLCDLADGAVLQGGERRHAVEDFDRHPRAGRAFACVQDPDGRRAPCGCYEDEHEVVRFARAEAPERITIEARSGIRGTLPRAGRQRPGPAEAGAGK